jgi:hypothetical protein
MGQVSIRRPWIAKNRSGEEETMPPEGVVTSEEKGAGDSARSARWSAGTGGAESARNRCARFTW